MKNISVNVFEFGPVVQDMSFEDISFFSSGGQQSCL